MSTEQEKRLHRCCFAGHRPEGILLSENIAKEWLRFQILSAIENGYTTFITGMGMGVDIRAAETVLQLRKENPSLHLIAVEPYPGFAGKWSKEWLERYNNILSRADLVKQLYTHYNPAGINSRINWMVEHSSRLIAIYNGSKGYTGSFVDYAKQQGLEVVLYPFPRVVNSSPRAYPLNLLDEIMDCQTYLASKPVALSNLPSDFDKRLMIAMASIPGDHSPAEILVPRFRDGWTLQAIGNEIGVSRERIRQLIEKYIKILRSPDILRYLNCGIEGIPERTTKAVVKRLEEATARAKYNRTHLLYHADEGGQ